MVLPWCYGRKKFRRDEGDVVTLRVRAKKRNRLRGRRVLAAVKKIKIIASLISCDGNNLRFLVD